jgi:hypothetical protein
MDDHRPTRGHAPRLRRGALGRGWRVRGLRRRLARLRREASGPLAGGPLAGVPHDGRREQLPSGVWGLLGHIFAQGLPEHFAGSTEAGRGRHVAEERAGYAGYDAAPAHITEPESAEKPPGEND